MATGQKRRRRMLLNLLFSSLVIVSTLALPPPSSQAKSSGAGISTITKGSTACFDSNVTLPILHNTTSTATGEKTRKRRKRTKPNEAKHATPTKQSKVMHTPKETGSREAACLRRIKREWKDAVKLGIAYDWMQMKTLSSNTTTSHNYVRIGPLHKNLLQWHFSVMGPPNSDYAGGVYHGRVLLPKTYPASPPRIQVYTPSGRFIPATDICLSASSFHPESWTPQWTILSLVEALRLHMLTTANEIGGKEDTPQQRRIYARASRTWRRGRINHALMIQQGMFATETTMHDLETEHDQVAVETRSSDAAAGGGVQVAQPRHQQTRDQVVAKRVVPPKLSTVLVRAVVQVLTSPPRLALLFLVTVFILLNRR